LPPDDLVGLVVGSYRIEAKVGEAPLGGIYRAIQINMNRPVRLYVLEREKATDPANVQRFISNASARANINHPFILAVYEAGQGEGLFFYSCEYVPASTLQQFADQGKTIDERTALNALKVAAGSLGYFASQKIPHDPVTANSILIGAKGQIRFANIASPNPSETLTTKQEMASLAESIRQSLPEQSDGSVPGLRELLDRLADPESELKTWELALQAIVANEPKIAPADAYKLDARERAAVKAVEEAKKKQKRSMIVNVAVSLTLLAVALGFVYWLVKGRGESYSTFDKMIPIPAGSFIYQDGQRVDLPQFYISEHPVTIGQYSEFLRWLGENPDKISEVAHADAPSGKDYLPEGWADMNQLRPPMPGYYTRAKRWGKYKGAALNLDSPVFGVDWYDAYAYAKWKGQRLPTEQEWEKAARGTSGNLFPWGNEKDDKRVNSGVDFNPNPEEGGNVDGWKRWSPVTAMRGDKSPFGVMGMAGNVSEWTGSWDESPELGGMKVPVIRGGNWQNADYSLTRRLTLRMAEQNDMVLGFRTASDQAAPAP